MWRLPSPRGATLEERSDVIELPGRVTTGVGSLPHRDPDAAALIALECDVPYVPQLPHDPAGTDMIREVITDSSDSQDLTSKLIASFARTKKKLIKFQVAGPVTISTALRVASPSMSKIEVVDRIVNRVGGIAEQITSIGSQACVFLDEPVLEFVSADASGPDIVMIQETIARIRAIVDIVGLHCCSNPDWENILALDLDLVSFDFDLSAKSLLHSNALERFLDRGRLVLGVVPTTPSLDEASSLANRVAAELSSIPSSLSERLLEESWFSPSCGLAEITIEKAEKIHETLNEIADLFRGGPDTN